MERRYPIEVDGETVQAMQRLLVSEDDRLGNVVSRAVMFYEAAQRKGGDATGLATPGPACSTT